MSSRTTAATAASAASRSHAARVRLAEKLRAAGWTCRPPREHAVPERDARGALLELKPTDSEKDALLRFLAAYDPAGMVRACNTIRQYHR